MRNHDICGCAYCKNYVHEIKGAYPELAEYLFTLGIDIEKPFEALPLEPDEFGRIEYAALYVVYGKPDGFTKTVIGTVTIDLADSHPSTEIKEAHFVIEIYPVRLKWGM